MPLTLPDRVAVARRQANILEKIRHVQHVVLPASRSRIVQAQVRQGECVCIELEMALRCRDENYRR